MLDIRESRIGRRGGGTVIVDRGIAHEEMWAAVRNRAILAV